MENKIFYIYEVKGIKNGCTTEWDKRCKQNFETYNITPVVVETYEYPNTVEYWQILGDREWELAELNGYPKGTHYRVAREKRIVGSKIGGRKNVESGQLKSVCYIGGKAHVESGHIFHLNKLKRKLTFEDAQKIRDLYSTKKYKQRELAKMYAVSIATISVIILNERYTQP